MPFSIDVHLAGDDLHRSLIKDVREGLASNPKSLSPLWFYDEVGSKLFEEITTLKEYYPTRAERALLDRYAPELAAKAGSTTLVELGAGACDKTRILLDAMSEQGNLTDYIPFDVSEAFVRTSASSLLDDYDGLSIHAVIGDFHRHLEHIPRGGRRLFAFLGGTIGNLNPKDRSRFLFDLGCLLSATDFFLLGADLVKNVPRIVAAYDDPQGVTSAFNKNVLSVINRELTANFDLGAFDHKATWNDEEKWMEISLRAKTAQKVSIGALDLSVEFESGEDLLTEISAKFTPHQISTELLGAGFIVDHQWGVDEGEFLLTLAHPMC